MLIKILSELKRHSLLISIFYTILLIVVSFISLDDLTEIEIEKSDKVFHFLVYFILVIIWYLTLVEKLVWSKKKLMLVIAISSIIFGIIIELLQGSLTSYRATDNMDVMANAFGVLLASASICLYNMNVKKD